MYTDESRMFSKVIPLERCVKVFHAESVAITAAFFELLGRKNVGNAVLSASLGAIKTIWASKTKS